MHAYPEKLCLMQTSLASGDFLLDPLAGIDLAPVFEEFRRHELILHGSDYDLRLFRKAFNFVPERIFDTMLASRLLGIREFGLTNLVFQFLGFALEKGPQKANWARRPLTERMEVYARNDTRHLKSLADLLTGQLREKGRLDWHQEMCGRMIVEAEVRPVDPNLVWRVKGSHLLTPPGLGALRELWHWREAEAVTANKPPFFILSHDLMVRLAAAAAGAAPVAPLLPRHLSPRRRTGVLASLEHGLAQNHHPETLRHTSRRQTEPEKRRFRELETRRDKRAEELGIDPTLIASRAMLLDLARDWAKHAAELMKWQRELLQ